MHLNFLPTNKRLTHLIPNIRKNIRYYPAILEQLEESGKTYYFGTLHFSENHTAFAQGETLDEAMAELQSNLIGAVEFAFKDDEIFPEPAPQKQVKYSF